MRRGLGSAIVYLHSVGDKDRYRDLVLSYCLRDIGYDVQVEGTRGTYLSFAIRALDAWEDVKRPIVDKFLSDRYDDRLAQQLTDLLAAFAGETDGAAKSALRSRYEQLVAERRLRNGARKSAGLMWEEVALARLGGEGFSFFRRYVTDLGQYIGHVPDGHDDLYYASFLEAARTKFGTRRVSAFLDPANLAVRRTRREQQAVAALAAAMRAHQTRRDHPRQQGDAPMTAEQAHAWARRAVAEGRRYGSIAYPFRTRANDSEKLKLAEAILCEPDDTVRGWMLTAFHHSPFPLDVAPLLAFAQSTNERLRDAAIGVLESIEEDAVHSTAVTILRTRGRDSGGLSLLNANYRRSDDAVIIDAVRRYRRNLPHHVVADLRNIYESHRSARSLPALLRAYRDSECAHCRAGIVRAMHRAQVLPAELLQECRFDSLEETRRFADRVIAQRGATAVLGR